MIHRVQLMLGPGQKGQNDVSKLDEAAKRTQANLCYEVNCMYLDTSEYTPLTGIPEAIRSNKLKIRNDAHSMAKAWPEDFQDYISCFKRDGDVDEAELWKSFGDKKPRAWSERACPEKIDGAWNWHPSAKMERKRQQKNVTATPGLELRTATTTAMPLHQALERMRVTGGGRSEAPPPEMQPSTPADAAIANTEASTSNSFDEFSAWIIRRQYSSEASATNMSYGNLMCPKMSICLEEPDPDDDYPYLTWLQRLLHAASRSGDDEVS